MRDEAAPHPDFGELEAYRRDEANAATVEHVAGCAQCQRNLEDLEQLAALVREDAAPLPLIPQEIDKRVLWHAQQTAARVRRQRRRTELQRWAIAATVLLGIATTVLWRRMNPGGAPTPAAKLDIVDALALARKLEAAQAADDRYDVNHDGRVDGADVERIARQAVALGAV